MYKSKLKTINNRHSRRMIECASTGKFQSLACVYFNYRDEIEEKALLRTLRIVIGVTNFAELFKAYNGYSMFIRSTLNEIYSYAYTLV